MSVTLTTAWPIFWTAKGGFIGLPFQSVLRHHGPKNASGGRHMARAPNRLSASEAVLRMAQKRLKARDLVEACLDRIEAREGQVHAWEALDADGARKRADMLDKRARPVGPPHGIPLAV